MNIKQCHCCEGWQGRHDMKQLGDYWFCLVCHLKIVNLYDGAEYEELEIYGE